MVNAIGHLIKPHRNGLKCHPLLMLDKIKVKNLWWCSLVHGSGLKVLVQAAEDQ